MAKILLGDVLIPYNEGELPVTRLSNLQEIARNFSSISQAKNSKEMLWEMDKMDKTL